MTLGGYALPAHLTELQRNLLINFQAATMMHELGHNLNLLHGGGDSHNRKPNYLSVMNYLYSPIGLSTIGTSEGDRYDYYSGCRLISLIQLTKSPAGSPAQFALDFSSGLHGDIDENAVDEREGLGRSNSASVDFNCNSRTDAPYARDLNFDGEKTVLVDHDDWANLKFVFRRTFAGNEHGPTLFKRSAVDASAQQDTLTDDTQPVADEPCPPLDIQTI